jgi:hypothetical protein
VCPPPVVRLVNVSPPPTGVGVGFGKPTFPSLFLPQQYALPLLVRPQLCSPPDVTDLRVMNGSMVMLIVPTFPSIVAVIVTAPGASVETTPLSETVANDGFVDAQVTTGRTRALPLESLGVALSVVVAKTPKLTEFGEISTEATEAGADPPASPLHATLRHAAVAAMASVPHALSTTNRAVKMISPWKS